MPTYNIRIYGRNKPRGLPEVGQMPPVPATAPDMSTRTRDVNTPFRLPRLYSSGVGQSPGTESLSSYHQMEYATTSPDLLPYRSGSSADYLQMSGSPLRVPVKACFDYPRLKHAIIAPKAAVRFTRSGRPNITKSYPSPSLINHSSSLVRPQTALSDTGSIHWALGTAKSVNFDQTGRSRHQGPFSREFTRKCAAPPNWVKMKYGRTHPVM